MSGKAQSQETRLLPPLNSLRAFDALARCGSLRAAALDLGVVPGAVRQQLAVLEEHFGVALVDRAGGRVALNPAGRRLADAVGVAFDIMSRAAEEISWGGRKVRLRVGAPMPMAAEWLIPRVPLIQAVATSLEIDVVPVPVAWSLSDMTDIDALIVGGEYKPLPDIAATPFMNDEFGPVHAAPIDGGVSVVARLEDMTALVARTSLK